MTYRIALIGDLSMQNPARLKRAIETAWPQCDLMIQLGDFCPAYNLIKEYSKQKDKEFLVIKGNHDEDWNITGLPLQWRKDHPLCTLIGLDNSEDYISEEGWKILENIPENKPVFLFLHKPLSTIILPDGTGSDHIMAGECKDSCKEEHRQDREKLKAWLKPRDSLVINGHAHLFAMFKSWYSPVIIEGRGGASKDLGFTILYITKDGYTAHPFLV